MKDALYWWRSLHIAVKLLNWDAIQDFKSISTRILSLSSFWWNEFRIKRWEPYTKEEARLWTTQKVRSGLASLGSLIQFFPSALKHMCSSKKKIKVEKKFKLTKTTEFLYNMHVSKYIIHMYMYIENKRGNEGWLVRIRESRPALRSQKVTSLVHNISLSKISQRLYQNTKKNWTEWPRLHVYGYAHHRSMYYS